jgi:protein involved in polysaccharide export with SLBB domain
MARARAQEARQMPITTDYRLGPGDKISMKYFYDPELNDSMEIRPDGGISLQLLGDVHAAGRSIPELRAELIKLYSRFLKDPEVSVNVESYRSLVSYVGGEVRNPGVVPLAPGMTALQAILSAGGYLRSGDMQNVVIIRDQGGQSPTFLIVNLQDEIRLLHLAEDVRLQPKDVVIVPISGIAEAGVLVQQYINDLLPLVKAFNLNYNFGIPPTAR